MNRRIILKTALVCVGAFLILSSIGIYFFSSRYELDTEPRHQVVIAAADISVGEIITNEMVTTRTIKESGYNTHMVQSSEMVVGTKALAAIHEGDYISSYNLLLPDKWYDAEDRIIILPMDVEGRLANLIKKGSLIDIKVEFKDSISIPQTVLSEVFVEDILDENGLSLGESIGSKKAYAKVVLNNEQRDRVYVASQYGRLIFELYCDNTQKPLQEDFVIPSAKMNNPSEPIPQIPETTAKITSKEDTP